MFKWMHLNRQNKEKATPAHIWLHVLKLSISSSSRQVLEELIFNYTTQSSSSLIGALWEPSKAIQRTEVKEFLTPESCLAWAWAFNMRECTEVPGECFQKTTYLWNLGDSRLGTSWAYFCTEYGLGFSTQILHEPMSDFGMSTCGEK